MAKPFWRLLRSFHVLCATKDYECKWCHQLIHAGDGYLGYVLVSKEHRLITEREHEECEPEDPWDDEYWKDWEGWDGVDEVLEEPLPKAA